MSSRSRSPSISRSSSRSPRSSRSYTPSSRSRSPSSSRSPYSSRSSSRSMTPSPQKEEPPNDVSKEDTTDQPKDKEPEERQQSVSQPAPSASPIRDEDDDHHSVESAPDEVELLLRYYSDKNVVRTKQLLGIPAEPQQDDNAKPWEPSSEEQVRVEHLCTSPHEGDHDGHNIIYIASYDQQKWFLQLIATHFKPIFDKLSVPVAIKMLQFQRYPTVFLLATLNEDIVKEPVDAVGNSLLHVCCMRRRPNGPFIKDLLSRFSKVIDIDDRNAEGLTALHLVAVRSSGIEGRDVAKILVQAGCNDEATSPSGETAVIMALNPFVRQVLGMTGTVKTRSIPEVDPDAKAQIDACKDSSQFPQLKDFTPDVVAAHESTMRLNAAADSSNQSGMNSSMAGSSGGLSPNTKSKKGGPKKLSAEASEAMVNRLYQQSLDKKERWLDTQMSRLSDLDKSTAKQLSEEDVEAAVSRLYDSELEMRTEKREELLGKYLRERPLGPELVASELDESANRLCRGSLLHKEKQMEQLKAKYAPEKESHALTKEQLDASAARLHDESRDKTKEKFDGLYQKYIPEGERKKLSKKQMQAMGDRLSQAK